MTEPGFDAEEMADHPSVLRVVPFTSFPKLLRTQRAARGISQTELASLLGVRPQTIGAWEAGKSPPQARFHAPLARFLGLRSAADVRKLAAAGTAGYPADDPREIRTAAVEDSPDLEIRLNLSRRIAAGEPLTAETIELFNRLLGEAGR